MPPPPGPGTRERLLGAALEVVYEQGFHRSTLGDIAAAADVPKGNVYYHFKTKEELGEAVVEQRLERQQETCARWDRLFEPKDRLRAFVQMSVDARHELVRHGCPVGTLCTELQKEGGPLAARAGAVFSAWHAWLQAQFALLGHEDAGGQAWHLLGAVQGATVLSHALADPSHVQREAERLRTWIATL